MGVVPLLLCDPCVPLRRLQEVLDGLAITNDHFKFALQHCNPSALRETLVEVKSFAQWLIDYTVPHRAPVLLLNLGLFWPVLKTQKISPVKAVVLSLVQRIPKAMGVPYRQGLRRKFNIYSHADVAAPWWWMPRLDAVRPRLPLPVYNCGCYVGSRLT